MSSFFPHLTGCPEFTACTFLEQNKKVRQLINTLFSLELNNIYFKVIILLIVVEKRLQLIYTVYVQLTM